MMAIRTAATANNDKKTVGRAVLVAGSNAEAQLVWSIGSSVIRGI